MAWTNKVLIVLAEQKNKDGALKSRWEIIQPTDEEHGKHFAPALQKTSFYVKDGELKRGYAQALTVYDMNWVRDNWDKVMAGLNPAPVASAQPTPTDAEIEEIPF